MKYLSLLVFFFSLSAISALNVPSEVMADSISGPEFNQHNWNTHNTAFHRYWKAQIAKPDRDPELQRMIDAATVGSKTYKTRYCGDWENATQFVCRAKEIRPPVAFQEMCCTTGCTETTMRQAMCPSELDHN
ncbi:hypothetical protein L5515_016287 [Caenorhabditis briggsae]|nr:hypothetical protein L5515_016287 [Caenorhabditis briggsae]